MTDKVDINLAYALIGAVYYVHCGLLTFKVNFMKKSLLTLCAVGPSLFGSAAIAAPGAVGVGAAMLNVRGGFEYDF